MEEQKAIKAIYGFEPMREGEYPTGFAVGHRCGLLPDPDLKVTAIGRRFDFNTSKSLTWYDVYTENGKIMSMQAAAVAEIHYQ